MPAIKDTDATHILAQDHRKVEELFSKYESASGRDRKAEIANKICDELKIHSVIEEEIFYPALRGKIEEDLLKEA
jgi:hemerythrin superfamily protein